MNSMLWNNAAWNCFDPIHSIQKYRLLWGACSPLSCFALHSAMLYWGIPRAMIYMHIYICDKQSSQLHSLGPINLYGFLYSPPWGVQELCFYNGELLSIFFFRVSCIIPIGDISRVRVFIRKNDPFFNFCPFLTFRRDAIVIWPGQIRKRKRKRKAKDPHPNTPL